MTFDPENADDPLRHNFLKRRELAEQEQRETASVLEEAAAIVGEGGDRQEHYGHPRENFTNTAAIWSVVLGTDVTPKQVALCMVGMKIAREVHMPKRDNLVDAAGYLLTAEMVDERA